ncbi:MAG TPA: FAD binding domain-containing protein [Thermoanaerobaculia bacterium]|nr:FAD binding domain-containing protein [Thermoanaerobaculia bacterium]
MRDHLLLSVNGTLERVRGDDAFATLSTFLRERLRLTGTKVVCAEGDCGACSVLVAREPAPDDEGPTPLDWQPVDSCIAFLHQLDGCHVLTVEGIPPAAGAELHPVQDALIEHFGSQCGFCTPGFVTTLAGAAETARRAGRAALDPHGTRRALTGNLCRCTGYLQILEAAAAVPVAACPPLDAVLAPETRAALALAAAETVRVAAGDRTVSIPRAIEEATAILTGDPETRVVAGATDLGVLYNKGRLEPRPVLQLGPRIPGFDRVEIAGGRLRAGAGASWTALLDAVRDEVPAFAAILERFGAPQIRTLGTVGGNLANASPIADSLPFLLVMDAVVEVSGPRGVRRVPIGGFYRSYKETALEPGELIAAIEVPLPAPDELLRLRKLSRRRDLDISSVTAAFRLAFEGERIVRARIAFGGVGPVVLRTPGAERLVEGGVLDLELARRAGRLAREEVAPITDVRGAAEYRARLVENLFTELAHELLAAPSSAAGG